MVVVMCVLTSCCFWKFCCLMFAHRYFSDASLPAPPRRLFGIQEDGPSSTKKEDSETSRPSSDSQELKNKWAFLKGTTTKNPGK